MSNKRPNLEKITVEDKIRKILHGLFCFGQRLMAVKNTDFDLGQRRVADFFKKSYLHVTKYFYQWILIKNPAVNISLSILTPFMHFMAYKELFKLVWKENTIPQNVFVLCTVLCGGYHLLFSTLWSEGNSLCLIIACQWLWRLFVDVGGGFVAVDFERSPFQI